MEVKPGYKLTEVGVIPKDWELSTLGSLSAVVRGASPRPINSPHWFDERSKIGWVRISDLTKSDMYLRETRQKLSEAGVKSSRPVPAGSLIMSICATVGRPAITEIDVCIHDGFVVLNNLKADKFFVFHLLKWIEPSWSKTGQTGSQMNLNTGIVNRLPVRLPAEQEQRAIAKALSDVDALLNALDRLIAKKRDLKQAVMQQLLTGKARLPGFDGEWKESKLGELGAVYGGLSGKSKAEFGDGNSRYVTFLSVVTRPIVKGDELGKVNVKRGEAQAEIAKGDLLFNGSSETPDEVALCALVAFDLQDVFLNSFCFGYRLNAGCSADGLFLTYLIRSDVGRGVFGILAQGSTRHNISKAAFREVVFELPHLSEQLEIVRVLREMDAEIAVLESRCQKTQHLKQGMMQELLSGKIRLVEPEPRDD